MPKVSYQQAGVTAGEEIIITGTIVYSRMVHKVEGEDLEKDIKNKTQRGMIPIEKPHYTITLKDPQIAPQHVNTPLGRYYAGQIYQTNGENRVTLVSKSTFPPAYYHQTADGKAVTFTPENDFGVGQRISVLVNSFVSRQMSSAPKALLLPAGDIAYYTASGNPVSDLAAFGLQLDVAEQAAGLDAVTAPADTATGGVNPFEQEATETPAPFTAPAAEPTTGFTTNNGPVNNPFAQ